MIRGKAKDTVMRLYFRGEITWQEAAEQIGVNLSTIYRWTPPGFYWQAARDKHVGLVIARATKMKVKAKRRKAPKFRVIDGGKA